MWGILTEQSTIVQSLYVFSGYSPSMMDSMRFAVGTSNNVLIKTRGRDTALDFKGALALAGSEWE